jgi:hypothetical protein
VHRTGITHLCDASAAGVTIGGPDPGHPASALATAAHAVAKPNTGKALLCPLSAGRRRPVGNVSR